MESEVRCDLAPAGWDCSRERGHAGPCAATPSGELGWTAIRYAPMDGTYLLVKDRCGYPYVAHYEKDLRAWMYDIPSHNEPVCYMPIPFTRISKPAPPRAEVSDEMVERAYRAWDRCGSSSKLVAMRAALTAALAGVGK